MKKYIITIAIMLTACASSLFADEVTSLSQLDRQTIYRIAQTKAGVKEYLFAESASAANVISQAGTGSSAAYDWAVFCSPISRKYYLYNFTTQKFLSANGTSCPFTTTATPTTFISGSVPGQWHAYNSGFVVGLSTTESSPIILEGETSDELPTYSFETVRTMTGIEYQQVRQAVLSYEVTMEPQKYAIKSIGSVINDVANLTEGMHVLLYSNGKHFYTKDTGTQLTSGGSNQPATGINSSMSYVFTIGKPTETTFTFKSGLGNYINSVNPTVGTNKTNFNEFTIQNSTTTADCVTLLSINTNQYLDAWDSQPTSWGTIGTNSQYKIYPVELEEINTVFDVLYDCYEQNTDNSDIRFIGYSIGFNDDNNVTTPSYPGYTLATQSSTGTVAQDTYVKCTYTNNLSIPFETTTVSNGIPADATSWYLVTVGGRYLTWDATNSVFMLSSKSLDQIDPYDLWCFTGNTFNGFSLYNLGQFNAEGSCLPLAADNNPAKADKLKLMDKTNSIWTLTFSDSKYYFNLKDLTLYMANDGCNRATVMPTKNNNAALTFTPVSTLLDGLYAQNTTERYVGAYKNDEELATFKTDYDTYNAAKTNEKLISAITSYDQCKAVSNRIELNDNRLYRIVNVHDPRYSLKVNNATVVQVTTSATDLNQYWQIDQLGKTSSVILRNAQTGNYMGDVYKNLTPTATDDEVAVHTYEMTNYGNAVTWVLKDAMSTETTAANQDYHCLHFNSGGQQHVLGWTKDAGASHWNIIPVNEFPISFKSNMVDDNGRYYTTTMLPFAVSMPTGVTAWNVSEVIGNQIVLSQVAGEGEVLPANTPVILTKGGAEENVLFLYVESDDASAPTANRLVGSPFKKTVEPNSLYGLGLPAGQTSPIGFYNVNRNYMTAFKAYLTKETTSDVDPEQATKGFRIIFDNGEVTNLHNLNVYPHFESNGVYDLQGRRVKEPHKGIYIVNGKKIYVK